MEQLGRWHRRSVSIGAVVVWCECTRWRAGEVTKRDREIIGAGQCYVMQGVKVQRKRGAEGQVLWVLENKEGEVRRRLGMGEAGVEMDPDMVHREYSDTLRFMWQREAPYWKNVRDMVDWESERVPVDIEEHSWDFAGRHAVIGLLDVEAAMQEWGEVLEEAEVLT